MVSREHLAELLEADGFSATYCEKINKRSLLALHVQLLKRTLPDSKVPTRNMDRLIPLSKERVTSEGMIPKLAALAAPDADDNP